MPQCAAPGVAPQGERIRIQMAQTATQLFLRRFSRSVCIVIGILSGTALVGWALNIHILKTLVPGLAAMNPLAAILLGLLAIALWRANHSVPASADPVVVGCAAIVALGAILKLVDLFTGMNINPDQWLFRERLFAPGEFAPSEMAAHSAVGLLLCAVSLLLLDVETRSGRRPAQPLLLFTAFLALLVLIGYGYHVLPLYTLGSKIPMALNTAIAFELFCLGALAARPDRGLMIALTSDTTGGAIARRLLPAALLIPLVVGALRFVGEKRGYIRVELGESLFTVANIVFFTALIWWNAKLLYLAECERAWAERRLAVQYRVAVVLAESPTIHEATPRILQAIGETLGWHAAVMWSVDEQNNTLRCAETWQADTAEAGEFLEVSRRTMFPYDSGLPGKVWAGREPVWIDDVGAIDDFPRAPAARKGRLRAGFAVPIRVDDVTFGVMEAFSLEFEQRDEVLLQVLSAVASQIGQFFERRRAEERLRQMTVELERSNTELQQFAYMASHDLSEPLRMVISYLQLLDDRHGKRLAPEAREFIGFAVDGAQRMQALMNDLLAYARVGTRGRTFERVETERIFNSALANLKVAIEESGAVIEREPLPTIHADALQLAQVFQNLIGNSLKFRGKTPLRVHIGARRNDAEWVFHVRDNGIGIEQKNFERIFDLFQRLHTRQEYPGTGMGLAICKKIIERHGGRIWVESTAGSGATFYFTLPA
jgi:signal transduction histidine kinase